MASVVEGFGRKAYQQEFVRYLTYALASCDETKNHLQLLSDTGSLRDQAVFQKLLEGYESLGRQLYRFRETVQRGREVKGGRRATAYPVSGSLQPGA